MRVGIIGAGGQGIRRARHLHPSLHLSGVYDTDVLAAQSFSKNFGGEHFPSVETLIDAVDVVAVCTPPSGHARLIDQALNAGVHVLCEKPLTLRGAAALELSQKARNKGLVLRAGFHLRHYAGARVLRTLVRNRDDVASVSVDYGSSRPEDFTKTWRADRAVSGGGVLVDQGVHVIDFVNFLFPKTRVDYCSVDNSGEFVVDDRATIVFSGDGYTCVGRSSWYWTSKFDVEVVTKNREVFKLSGLEGRYGPQRLFVNSNEIMLPELNVWESEWADFLAELEGFHPVGSSGAEASVQLATAMALAGGPHYA